MTELGAYLREDPVKADYARNPVRYWLDKNGDHFARMALDFCTAPGEFLHHALLACTDAPLFKPHPLTSNEPFSKGSLTVSKHRHSLSDKSTRAAIVLSSWLQVGGIVVDKDIIEVFEEKARRPKASGASQGESIEIN